VFNECKEGFIIEKDVWVKSKDLILRGKGSPRVIFKDLMLSMLDKNALFFLSFGGSVRGMNKVQLAEVHRALKNVVYSCE
jgi:hypothetical protein